MNSKTLGTHPATVPGSPAWWRFGHVWMVIAGPAIVVVASFITLYLAIVNPDPVVDADYYRKGVTINQTLGDANNAASLAPAMQGRNHAATGVPLPKPEGAGAKP